MLLSRNPKIMTLTLNKLESVSCLGINPKKERRRYSAFTPFVGIRWDACKFFFQYTLIDIDRNAWQKALQDLSFREARTAVFERFGLVNQEDMCDCHPPCYELYY